MYSINKSKFLTDTELISLNNCLNKFRSTNQRDVLLIELALNTGARASEILNISAIDIDVADQTIFIKGLKGSDDREIPLPDVLFASLLKYSKGISGKLFPITYHHFRHIWTLYRPVEKKLHAIRHTFAINLYRRTKDIKLVQLALGHRSITNSEIYLKFEYNKTEMRKLLVG